MLIEGHVRNTNPTVEKLGKKRPGWKMSKIGDILTYDSQSASKENIIFNLCEGVNHYLSKFPIMTLDMRESTRRGIMALEKKQRVLMTKYEIHFCGT